MDSWTLFNPKCWLNFIQRYWMQHFRSRLNTMLNGAKVARSGWTFKLNIQHRQTFLLFRCVMTSIWMGERSIKLCLHHSWSGGGGGGEGLDFWSLIPSPFPRKSCIQNFDESPFLGGSQIPFSSRYFAFSRIPHRILVKSRIPKTPFRTQINV